MDLFEENRGLLYRLARRYEHIDSAVDTEDLVQAGFIGLLEAKRTYDPAKGAWSAWAWDYIRKAMRETVGLRGTRRRAHLGAIALDAPLGDEYGADTLLDQLEDVGAPAIDSHLLETERVAIVRGAVRKLEADRREVVTRHYFEGQTYERVGQAMSLSVSKLKRIQEQAFTDLQKDKGIKSLRPEDLDRRTRFYWHRGYRVFNTCWTSATEAVALWRIEQRERIQCAQTCRSGMSEGRTSRCE